MNRRYEAFLLERNPYDGQVATLRASDELLTATVRRHMGEHGPAKTAGRLYELADLIAVRGVEEDPAPEEREPSNNDRKSARRVPFLQGAVIGFVIGAITFGSLIVEVFK